MESKLVSTLTDVFLSLRDINPHTSLRLWYDDGGMIKYYLTNNPLKMQNNDSTRVHPSVIAQENLPEVNSINKRTRKRRCPVEQPPSPEISRGTCSNMSREEVVSDFEADRDVSVTSIPCSNRFDVLEDDSSGPVQQNDQMGQADEDKLDTGDIGDVAENILEISNGSVTAPSQNRLCNLCKKVPVSESYHVRCEECFSKHGLYTRYASFSFP